MEVRLRYVIAKRLRGGAIAWYWNPPADSLAHGLVREALGTDYAAAMVRALELNAMLDACRSDSGGAVRGSVAWGIRAYQHDEEYRRLKPSTQRVYDQALVRIAAAFGRLPARAIQYRQAKAFYHDLRRPAKEGGPERLGQANGTLRVARLLWEYFINEEMAKANPFRRVRLSGLPSRTVRWSREQLAAFIAQADRLGVPEIGSAALLAFELCQREGDILALTWAQIQDGRLQIRQNKTGASVWLPLGEIPGVSSRLATIPRRTGAIIADASGRPWADNPHQFRKMVRRVADAAGLPGGLTFGEIMRQTGHRRSDTMRRYIRSGSLFDDRLTRKMGL